MAAKDPMVERFKSHLEALPTIEVRRMYVLNDQPALKEPHLTQTLELWDSSMEPSREDMIRMLVSKLERALSRPDE